MYRVLMQRPVVGFAVVIILLSFRQPFAPADVESPRVVLGPGVKDLVVGPGMNAAGRDLRGSQFVTQNLNGAVFDGCSLYGVRIAGCSLKHASFRGAVFAGSEVDVTPSDEGANFTDASINGVSRFGQSRPIRFNFLYGIDLHLTPQQLMSTWSYKNKDLHQCVVRASYPYPSSEVASFNFQGADLREATLLGNLSKSDFTGAHIDGAFFGNDSITFGQLASTRDFRHRRLRVRLFCSGKPGPTSSEKWDFSHINLTGSDLSFRPSDADFTDATIRDCTIRNGLSIAQLYSTHSYQQGDLTGLHLWWIDLSGFDFSGVNLTGGTFAHCKFARTNIEDAVITGARFFATSDLTVQQIKSTWNYKHGRMNGIDLPSELNTALAEEGETR